ncbi:MAG: hypothetical protein QOJ09_1831, partial [Actinomycetota bacterium]|nr:hypothetical protein [Actinomycetota bacterium]
ELGGLEPAGPDAAVAAVATTVGIATTPGRTLHEAVVDDLTEHRRLLVLDACEHTIDAVARLVDDVSRRGGRTAFLATSREALSVRAEQRWPVATLPVPDHASDAAGVESSAAGQLFLDRAAAVAPRFTLTADAAARVAAVCRRVEGIPLAIELAAARLGEVHLDRLAASLEQVLELEGGYRTDAPRHRTMRALVEWSVDWLSPVEQAVYRRLAPLRTSNGREACVIAAQAAEPSLDPKAIEQAIDGLIGKSLLMDEGGGRVRMLDPIREHAAERLTGSGEEAAVMTGLLTQTIERRSAGMVPPQERRDVWTRFEGVSFDTDRALLAWSADHRPTDMARLVVTLQHELVVGGHWEEGFRWLDLALSGISAGDLALRAALLHVGSALAQHQGDAKHARDLAERSLTAAEAALEAEGEGRSTGAPSPVGPAVSIVTAANAVAVSLLQERRLDEAEAMFTKTASMTSPQSLAYATVLLNTASIHILRGDLAGAERVLREAAAVFDGCPVDANAVATRMNLAAIRGMQGDHGGAAREFERVIELAEELGARSVLPMAEVNLGIARRHLGDPRAVETLRAGLRRAREQGDPMALLPGLKSLGEVARSEGDFNELRRLADDVIAVASRIPDESTGAWGWALLATSQAALGNSDAAASARRYAITTALRHGMPDGEAPQLLLELAAGLASVAPAKAAQLAGTADAVYPAGMPRQKAYTALEEDLRATLRARLGDEGEALMEAGRLLDVTAALELAAAW